MYGSLADKESSVAGGSPQHAAATLAASCSRLAAKQVAALSIISFGVFWALSIWFAASAVLKQLKAELGITDAEGSWLTSAVSVGFCFGCLASAILNLADLYEPPFLIWVGSMGAAASGASILLARSLPTALLAQLLAGLFLSLVYPPAVKLTSSWYPPERRSGAIGVMFGCFCLGSASPQLLAGLATGFSWKLVVGVTCSGCALAGNLVLCCVKVGPFAFSRSAFEPLKVVDVFCSYRVVLSISAYCGHMWELFCFWAWCDRFLQELRGLPPQRAHLLAFLVIAMGGPGSWIGGRLGDRYGPARTALATVGLGGACTAVLGNLGSEGPFAVWFAISLLWGLMGMADSPNYSTLITIHADQKSVGTAITSQLFCGYLVTVVSTWLVPVLSQELSWRWALASLAAGPLVSMAALWSLERSTLTDERPTLTDRDREGPP